jgi:TetR/AcrR family transcriptional regulator, repressor of fatR-cypB operon
MSPRLSDPQKEEGILTAALELFNERGFHGTTVPSVAERAGIGAGTIYHYFESKEELVNILYRRWKGAVSRTVLEGFPIEKPAREQFRFVWERMTDFALLHPREFAFLELHHHRPYLDKESLAAESDIVEFGINMVLKAQADLVLKPVDAALLMALANGAFIGVFRQALEDRIPMTKAMFMVAEQCCWEAIRA